MLIVKILAIAGGAFLNRVRGGLFDFCGNLAASDTVSYPL